MLTFWDFIQVYVFTTNHHLKDTFSIKICFEPSLELSWKDGSIKES